jgi:hypothetical protein
LRPGLPEAKMSDETASELTLAEFAKLVRHDPR